MKIEGYQHFCTVGDLRKFLEKNNLPDDAKVLVQRIEDRYFDNHNWGTINKEGEQYNDAIQYNKEIDEGKYEDKEQYPLIKFPLIKFSEEDLESFKERYIVAWCPVKFKDDDNLYLDCHY